MSGKASVKARGGHVGGSFRGNSLMGPKQTVNSLITYDHELR